MTRLFFIGGLLAGSLLASAGLGGVSIAFQDGESANPAPIVEVTDESFEKDVLQSSGAVLLHFWADWSGPSKIIAPALEDMAMEMGDAVTFARINVDESPATPDRLGIRGVPTLLLFRDGQIAGKKIGAAPKDSLIEWVESVLDE